jgi:peptidoglycan/xylan/chitin deacetylase (PgdA/CDA1 family)
LAELAARITAGSSHADLADVVALTVDDGFADTNDLFFPLCAELGIPFTFFVVTDFIDHGRLPWPSELGQLVRYATVKDITWPFSLNLGESRLARSVAYGRLKGWLGSADPKQRRTLLTDLSSILKAASFVSSKAVTWDQLRLMSRYGMEIGSHTVYHSQMPFLDAGLKATELAESKRRIEDEVGRPCRFFAYPNGSWDKASAAAVSQAGYEGAVTQDWGVNHRRESRFTMKRIEIPWYESLATFRCRIAACFRPRRGRV